MWVRIIGVPAGKPFKLYTKSTVAAVIVPELSRVRWNVMVAFPFAFWSALVIGGVSFAALSAAVNTTVLGCVLDGDDGLLLPHAAASTATPTSRYRFM